LEIRLPSDDGSDTLLAPLQAQYADTLRVIKLPQNRGKGAAILAGITQAQAQGFTHVLTMDADHQHPAGYIKQFMQRSKCQSIKHYPGHI
jgi:glycosyltransferase involved in cell wall biosynthesis